MANLTGRSFSQALIFLKAGFAVSREPWTSPIHISNFTDWPKQNDLSNADIVAEDWIIEMDIPPPPVPEPEVGVIS